MKKELEKYIMYSKNFFKMADETEVEHREEEWKGTDPRGSRLRFAVEVMQQSRKCLEEGQQAENGWEISADAGKCQCSSSGSQQTPTNKRS